MPTVVRRAHTVLLASVILCTTDVKLGTGPVPEAGDVIVVDYTARELVNNTVYDGSRGFAFTIGNSEVCTLLLLQHQKVRNGSGVEESCHFCTRSLLDGKEQSWEQSSYQPSNKAAFEQCWCPLRRRMASVAAAAQRSTAVGAGSLLMLTSRSPFSTMG